MTKILGIEGLPGAGKSHFLTVLSKNNKNFKVFTEPLDKFSTLKKHEPLTLLYSNPTDYAGSVQLHILNQQRNYWSSILSSIQLDPIIVERSLESLRVFTDTFRDLGYINDFNAEVLNDSLQRMMGEMGIKTSCDKLVFLDLPTEDLIRRILDVRKRNCELSAPKEFWSNYLNTLRKNYLEYLERFKAERGKDSVLIVSTEDRYVLAKIVSFLFQ